MSKTPDITSVKAHLVDLESATIFAHESTTRRILHDHAVCIPLNITGFLRTSHGDWQFEVELQPILFPDITYRQYHVGDMVVPDLIAGEVPQSDGKVMVVLNKRWMSGGLVPEDLKMELFCQFGRRLPEALRAVAHEEPSVAYWFRETHSVLCGSMQRHLCPDGPLKCRLCKSEIEEL